MKRDERMEWDDDGMVLKLKEEDIALAFYKSFKNRFVNLKERFALSMYDSKCILICHVDSFTPISMKASS